MKSRRLLLGVFAAIGLLAATRVVQADYVAEVLIDNPLAYYQFNETGGVVAADSSTAGANHDGTYLGGVTLGQPAASTALGTAVAFNGVDGRVQIPDHADFDLGTGDTTIEMWFHTDVTARGDLFTYKGGGGDLGVHSRSQAAGGVAVWHNGLRSNSRQFSSGQWHHLAVTRSGGQERIYLDGARASLDVANGDSWDIPADLLIGSNHGGTPATPAIPFDGLIDEVAIYGTALSAARVAEHHFAGAGDTGYRSVGVNFRRSSGQHPMDPNDLAGFVPQRNWNNSDNSNVGSNANIAGPVTGSLVDDLGAVVPGLSIDWSANGSWSANADTSTGHNKMMGGYLDDQGPAGATVVSVAGIPYEAYDVYAFMGSDGNGRTGRVKILGSDEFYFSTNSNPFPGYIQTTDTTGGSNPPATFARWTELTDDSFTLEMNRISNNVGLHGIQIVEVEPPPPVGMTSISLNFIGGRNGAQTDGIVTGTAGVDPQANWNNLASNAGATLPGQLVAGTGQVLGTTSVAWSSNNTYTITTTGFGDQDAAMMKGYLDTNNTSLTTVTVADLPSDWLEYDIIVYFDGDGSNSRQGQYELTADSGDVTLGPFADNANWPVATGGNAFAQAVAPGGNGNFMLFSDVSGSGFTLTTRPMSGSPPRAPINGIQIIATSVVPEPGSATLLLFVLLAALSWPCRRR